MPQLDQSYANDLAAALEAVDPLVVQFSGVEAFMLISQLQLALRHPENSGHSADYARHVVSQIASLLPPIAQRLVAMGDDPSNDTIVL